MTRWLLLLLIFLLLQPDRTAAQQQLLDFTRIYYRSNPFAGSMKQFLQHLTGDPEILDKRIQHRTQNQLYSFSGRYRKYSRFFFVPDSVRITLREAIFPFSNDPEKGDTVIIYQINAYASPGTKGHKDVVREWEKMKKAWSKKFFDREEEDVIIDNAVTGRFLHLYLPLFSVSPLTIGWTTLPDPDRLVLMIILRLKQDQDYVGLPGALYNAQ